MWIWITGAAAFGAAAGAILSYWINRRQRRRELEEISALARQVLREEEISARAAGEETLYARIEDQLIRIQHMEKGRLEDARKSHEKLQRLITEIAHQMRVPLSNVRSYLDLAEGAITEDPVKAVRHLGAAREAEEQIEFLVESFIKMSRLEHHIIQIHKESVDIKATILNALGQIEAKAREKELEFRISLPDSMKLDHDPNWLKEAIVNVLDNAVKYSPKGGVVEVKAEANEMFFKLGVRDYGIGIEEGEEEKIFQRFYRGRRVADQEGVGVGLYLARQIVLAQGGFMRSRRRKEGLLIEVFFPM